MDKKRTIRILLLVMAIGLASVAVAVYACTEPYRWSGALCEAIRQGDTNAALQLIEDGTDKGYSMDTLSTYPSPMWAALESTPTTPLQAACIHSNYTVAQQLLAMGATVHPAEGGLSTEPILCVIRRAYSPEDLALIRLLVQHGAALEDDASGVLITDAAFRAPLNFHTEPDSVTGEYPYDETVAKGITDVFLLLAEHRDCYVVNGAGRNALHCAAAMGNWYLVTVLTTQFDFPLEAEDINGKKAYDLAQEQGASEELLTLLRP